MNNTAQSKVSMVMPVYNKIDYIDMMLESVYNQLWDNIELIMVNDGATDGTRERLTQWLPKFRTRGFEVVIIDQENQGIPSAVKAGLMRVTGDYVCLVDCDDRLEPQYVSAMAGWLEQHPEDQWTACLFNRVLYKDNGQSITVSFGTDSIPQPPLMMEKYLSSKYATEVWIYMVRSNYLKKCMVTDHYVTDIRSTQEPGFLFPLILGGGKIKIIEHALYNHNCYASRASASQSVAFTIDFQDKYKNIIVKTINKLNVDNEVKEKWLVMAEFSYINFLMYKLAGFSDGKSYLFDLAMKAAELIKKSFKPDPCITTEHILESGYDVLSTAIADCFLAKTRAFPNLNGRVIGIGVLGKTAKKRIPDIVGSPLEPSELWDQAASTGDAVCGIPVLSPDYHSLKPEDTVIIFPINPEAKEELCSTVKRMGVIRILFDADIERYLPICKYPLFYGECKFVVQ